MEIEDLKELVEMADKLNEKKIENDKGNMLESVTKQIKECKRVFLSVSENGCIVAGSGLNVLGALSLLANEIKTKTNLDDGMILQAIKIGLEGENEKPKEDSDIEEILKKFKEIMED